MAWTAVTPSAEAFAALEVSAPMQTTCKLAPRALATCCAALRVARLGTERSPPATSRRHTTAFPPAGFSVAAGTSTGASTVSASLGSSSAVLSSSTHRLSHRRKPSVAASARWFSAAAGSAWALLGSPSARCTPSTQWPPVAPLRATSPGLVSRWALLLAARAQRRAPAWARALAQAPAEVLPFFESPSIRAPRRRQHPRQSIIQSS